MALCSYTVTEFLRDDPYFVQQWAAHRRETGVELHQHKPQASCSPCLQLLSFNPLMNACWLAIYIERVPSTSVI